MPQRRKYEREGLASNRWQMARAVRTANVAARRAAKALGQTFPAPHLAPPSCEAAALYRAEKVAAQLRGAPLMDEAKAAYARLMADLALKARGGRPKRPGS